MTCAPSGNGPIGTGNRCFGLRFSRKKRNKQAIAIYAALRQSELEIAWPTGQTDDLIFIALQ
jgi:hypothetical protein